MILIGICTFFIISLYTLLNYILTRDFFNYFEYNLEELSLISRTKTYTSINYLIVSLFINSRPYSF